MVNKHCTVMQIKVPRVIKPVTFLFLVQIPLLGTDTSIALLIKISFRCKFILQNGNFSELLLSLQFFKITS